MPHPPTPPDPTRVGRRRLSPSEPPTLARDEHDSRHRSISHVGHAAAIGMCDAASSAMHPARGSAMLPATPLQLATRARRRRHLASPATPPPANTRAHTHKPAKPPARATDDACKEAFRSTVLRQRSSSHAELLRAHAHKLARRIELAAAVLPIALASSGSSPKALA